MRLVVGITTKFLSLCSFMSFQFFTHLSYFSSYLKGLYYGMGFFFLLCDKTDLLCTYKLPRKKHRLPPPNELTPEQLKKHQLYEQKQTSLLYSTLFESVIGHFFIQPLALYFLLSFLPSTSPILSPNAPLPSFLQLYLLFLGANFTNEFLFYWLHRLCHTYPFLYQNIHKQHHEHKETIGFAAEYAHVLEGVCIYSSELF